MKKSHPWHETLFGRAILWLGSVQLAVPVLVIVAGALAWGTYLDSTQGSKVAKSIVYGSWWFMATMGLVCVSLLFAVVTRYPWKQRHVGFITVHAGILALIFGGFWSMLGRVEGRLGLEAGTSANSIELEDERLELASHTGGRFDTLGGVEAPSSPASFTLGGVPVQVVEHWENTREEQEVHDDSPQEFRGVQIQLGPVAESAVWAGDEAKSGGPLTVMGLTVRVLADGSAWEPPAKAGAPASPAGPSYFFIVGDKQVPLAEEGKEAFPGWTVASIKRFTRATVAGDGLADNPSSPENPAIEVTISDGKGNTERHTAFPKFPDMPMSKNLTGTLKSGARLAAAASARDAPANGETIVVFGPISATRIGYVGADGAGRVIENSGPLPWTLDLGTRKVILLQQFAHARGGPKFVKAPPAEERRPALVLRIGDSPDPVIAPWKAMTPVTVGGRDLIIRYGPSTVLLPFTVRLDEFRKKDYPGTEMAMSYESAVSVSLAGGQDHPYVISMNQPYAGAGWKVYQSGFVGANVSIFSVMHDPGLPLTYVGAIVLCVGILVTFYSRSFSWGHPGIPVASIVPASQESPNGPLPAPAPRRDSVGVPLGAGV